MKITFFIFFVLFLVSCEAQDRHDEDRGSAAMSGATSAEGEAAPTSFFTLNDQGLLTLSEGYAVEVPSSDYIVMFAMEQGEGTPYMVLDLMNKRVQFFGSTHLSGMVASLDLSADAIKAYRQSWTADRLAGIPPRSQEIVLGGRSLFVHARMGDALFDIYHENPDHPVLLELWNVYEALVKLVDFANAPR